MAVLQSNYKAERCHAEYDKQAGVVHLSGFGAGLDVGLLRRWDGDKPIVPAMAYAQWAELLEWAEQGERPRRRAQELADDFFPDYCIGGGQ